MKERILQYKAEHPKKRVRDIATGLGISEAELLFQFMGSSVIPLKADFKTFIEKMPDLGRVMVLTRNESCVHERKGVFEHIDMSNDHVGLVVGDDIDLRMFLNVWKYIYAVFEDESIGFKNSFQIFDEYGDAVLKIYPQSTDYTAVFDQVVRDFQLSKIPQSIQIIPKPQLITANPADVDIQSFQEEWKNLKDTHDFFPLVKKYQLSRIDAIRNGGEFVRSVSNDASTQLLQTVASKGIEIMVFVANRGNIQIHTGKVENILAIPDWINVMDTNFNLHLRTIDIAETYIVRKPTVDGDVHSLECFDAKGNLIVQFFGKRKPGMVESEEWRECLVSIK